MRRSPLALVDAWGSGFWTLVPFTLQMSMMLISGYVLASSPPVFRIIGRIASWPRTAKGAVCVVAVASMVTALLNWGFSLIGTAILAREVGRRMFRFGGMKLFVDGTGGDALGHRYDDVKWTQDELNHLLSSADGAGIQTIMHVVTDGGLRMARAAIEETRRRNPAKPYLIHRIEHGADRGDIDAVRHLRDLGIRISITPGRLRPGATRPRYRTLVRENVDPVLITDTTGTTTGSSDVLFKIACAAVSVDEGGGAPKGEELGFEEALRLFTLGNAQCGYEDRDKGSITVGKLGDFAVLSADPTAARPKDLFGLKVDATVLGGDVVFRR